MDKSLKAVHPANLVDIASWGPPKFGLHTLVDFLPELKRYSVKYEQHLSMQVEISISSH